MSVYPFSGLAPKEVGSYHSAAGGGGVLVVLKKSIFGALQGRIRSGGNIYLDAQCRIKRVPLLGSQCPILPWKIWARKRSYAVLELHLAQHLFPAAIRCCAVVSRSPLEPVFRVHMTHCQPHGC